jgi:hypothetical protein
MNIDSNGALRSVNANIKHLLSTMQSNMNNSDWLTVAANYREIASLAISAAASADRRDDEQIASATADTNNNSKGE